MTPEEFFKAFPEVMRIKYSRAYGECEIFYRDNPIESFIEPEFVRGSLTQRSFELLNDWAVENDQDFDITNPLDNRT